MRRAPLLAPLLLGLACASGPVPLPAGTSAGPALGDPLELLLAKLAHAEGAPAEVALRELRAVDVSREPWRTLDLDAARTHTGLLGLVAGRRCRWREGLWRHETLRASWYLLRAGRLEAFDHAGFGAACAPRPAYEPAREAAIPIERSLGRYLSQRYPTPTIAGEERLARGLRLLERGRREDAQRELTALDHRIAELGRRQSESSTPDAERSALAREEETLRPLRAQLLHALDEEAPPEEERP